MNADLVRPPRDRVGDESASVFLFGVAPHDPLSFGVATALLLAAAGLASYLPARRAARVDPLVALRAE